MLLSSGEFSRMCNISRELLIHYDRIDLLKPKIIADNGYRYYSLEQLYLYDAIRFFMDAGMSTKEIRDYLDHRTTELFLGSIQERIDCLQRQRDVLNARIGMMEKMRYITQRALRFPKSKPSLANWDELCFITTDIACSHTEHTYAQAISEHARFCRTAASVATFPLGRIVDVPDAEHAEAFRYTKLITWIDPPKNPEKLDGRILRKPKGTYAVILHQGGPCTVAQSYADLLTYIEEEGFTQAGPIFEMDVNSYLTSDSPEDYLLHISTLIEE